MYATEEQQVEQLKKIWKEYGWPTILGVLIAMVIVFGWRFYQEYKTKRAEMASSLYMQMTMNVMSNRQKEASDTADQIKKHYSDTPYAALAALSMAKSDVSAQKFDAAKQELSWVLKKAHNKTMRDIATLRLSRILLAEKNPTEALQTLNHIHSGGAFASLLSESRGDVYVELNQTDQARDAYQQALDQLPNAGWVQPLWRMNLQSLPRATHHS